MTVSCWAGLFSAGNTADALFFYGKLKKVADPVNSSFLLPWQGGAGWLLFTRGNFNAEKRAAEEIFACYELDELCMKHSSLVSAMPAMRGRS